MVRSTIGPLDIGFHLIVLALTMIIVGGAMSWKGAVIGAIIFTWLPSLLVFVGKWQTLLYGIIVAVAAVLLPRGIHGVFVDLTRCDPAAPAQAGRAAAGGAGAGARSRAAHDRAGVRAPRRRPPRRPRPRPRRC